MLGRLAGDYSLPFTHHIKSIGSQIGERLFFPIWPQDFHLIETLVAA